MHQPCVLRHRERTAAALPPLTVAAAAGSCRRRRRPDSLLLIHPPPTLDNPPACTQRPFLPPGPYLAGLRVLAMSDARGFQDDRPWEELAGPLEGARALQVTA